MRSVQLIVEDACPGGRPCHAGTVGDVPGTVRPAGEPGGDGGRDEPVLGKRGPPRRRVPEAGYGVGRVGASV